MAPRHDVFLSHSRADQSAVEALAHRLTREGIRPWLSAWNLIPGVPWQVELEHALETCSACAVFVGGGGIGPWENEELRAAINRRTLEGHGRFRVIPVLLPGACRGDRSKLPPFLATTTWVEFPESLDDPEPFRRLVHGIRGTPPGPSILDNPLQGSCPYRGLQCFDVDDAPFFFGREAITGWLLDKVRCNLRDPRRTRFLAIVGPSGSGKSSLARAGLIAAMRHSHLSREEQPPTLICRPGRHPLESLAICTCSHLARDRATADTVRSFVRSCLGPDGERTLHIEVSLALQNRPQDITATLLIDQFEELFSQCPDEDERRRFIDNLHYAATTPFGRSFVILAMRADFYGRCAEYPSLAAALSEHQVLVGPMTPQEIRDAIVRPAQLVGCRVDEALAERLLLQAGQQPGGLPILEDALLELWNRREAGTISLASYEAIGGLQGALENRANALLDRLSLVERDLCRQIMLRLVQPSEGSECTRRRVSLSDLHVLGAAHKTIGDILQSLIDARLIVVEGRIHPSAPSEPQISVEVAHEALVQCWSALRQWLQEDQASWQLRSRLSKAVDEWNSNHQDPSYLYSGTRLKEARIWAASHGEELNENEARFLRASSDREGFLGEAALRSLGRMSAGLIHEVNNPLNFAKTGLYVLRSFSEQVPQDRRDEFLEVLTDVQEGIQRVCSVISDLRQFSHPGGRDLCEVGVRRSAEAALQILSSELREDVCVENELPVELVVLGDAGKLTQVFLNLLQNSVDALRRMPVGLRPRIIRLSGQHRHESTQIRVWDNGPGIPLHFQAHVFEPFFTTKDIGHGIGLGLSVCFRILADMGAGIAVDSVPGQHTEMVLTFPRQERRS